MFIPPTEGVLGFPLEAQQVVTGTGTWHLAGSQFGSKRRNMQITATVTIFPEDNFTQTPEDAAENILEALGGDIAKDICTVNISFPNTTVGAFPTPPAPAPQPE